MRMLVYIVYLLIFTSTAVSADELFSDRPQGLDLTPKQQSLLAKIQSSKIAGKIEIKELNAEQFDKPNTDFTFGQLSTYSLESQSLTQKDRFKTWIGKLLDAEASSQESILTIRGESAAGTIITETDTFLVRPLGGGAHAIIQLQQDKMPEEHPPIKEPDNKDEKLDQDNTVGSTEIDTVSVLIAYTDAAEQDNTFLDMSILIEQAVEETNRSYENSGILAQIEVVHTMKVDYTENGFESDVDRLSDLNDGYMDSVHGERDKHKADVVVLISDEDSYCGYADAIGANEDTAFAAVYHECATGYFSFGHEIGHLFGARHNKEADPAPGYAHGYYIEEKNWRTVMSYNCPNGCVRNAFWSNPSKKIPGTSLVIGIVDESDNAKKVNETRHHISKFR